jgi:hypothetical protein
MENIKINYTDPTITISSTELNKLIISENNIEPSKTYTKNDKKLIISRIDQIKNKKVYLILFKIIDEDKNYYKVNANGIFLNFNNISDNTLFKIEKVLDRYDEAKKKKVVDNKWKNLLQTQYDSEENSILSDDKLSNHEKMFLKKQQQLNEQDIVFWGSSINDEQ